MIKQEKNTAPDDTAQVVGRHPANQKAAGSVSQLGCVTGLQVCSQLKRRQKTTNQCFSLTSKFSPSLSLSLPLSLKIKKIQLEIKLKN